MSIKSRITVKDVAIAAGVSTATVSRVISDNPRISQETKDKVHKVMEALKYEPNAIARSLASQKTGIIGVIMPVRSTENLLNPFFPEALRGIVQGASKYDYDILLSTNSKAKDETSAIKSFIRGGKVDGLILMTSSENDPNLIYLMETDFPFTVIGSDSGFKINTVDNDNVKAAIDITEHIIRRGKKNLYFAAGDKTLNVTKDRLLGFKKALEKHGLPYSDKRVYTGDFNEESGKNIANKLLELKVRPDAVVATDDVIAFGLAKTMTDAGLKIPEDIAIGSFNNSILSRYSECQLTTIDINAYDLGDKAVEQVYEAISTGARNLKKIIKHTLIERQSTAEV
ncbi:MAG: LacI family DNA-binding transcriptional regulator [Clostridiaceae bacterium]